LQLPGAAGPSFNTEYHHPTASQAAQAAYHIPDHQQQADVDAFLQGLHLNDNKGKSAAHIGGPSFNEFDAIFAGAQQISAPPLSHLSAPPPPSAAVEAVAPSLRAFFESSRAQLPFRPLPLPSAALAALSIPDQCRIRDRATILSRQMYSDSQGGRFADEQVGRLLASLNIDPAALPASVTGATMHEWDRIFQQGGGGRAALHHPMVATENAVSAAAAARQSFTANAWVNDFQQQSNKWAEEFTAEDTSGWAAQFASEAEAKRAERDDGIGFGGDALHHTRRLVDTLSQDNNPKMQNSKFLQFVSKMSRGEIILENNEAKEVSPQVAAWADEFSTQQQQQPGHNWAQEFHAANDMGTANSELDSWANQFINGTTNVAAAGGGGGGSNWEEEYLQELERIHGPGGPSANGGYVMSENNPFLLDTNSFAKGRDLFRRGILNEAVLALEAECQRNPSNAEAWRLLGTVQAENDDDKQAIAAMNRAIAADPNNSDVLLSLGVSHTNELEQSEALGYLRQWLLKHNIHGQAAAAHDHPPLDSSQAMSAVITMFKAVAASQAGSTDTDVHIALGVISNLARNYDKAADWLRKAAVMRPTDYSVWNKLGATLANSGRSGEAQSAYRKALELKPNYVRAWTNMGISCANLADYEGGARYYVRALALNPKASLVWGYLRNTLTCADRMDLVEAADREDLAVLQRELGL